VLGDSDPSRLPLVDQIFGDSPWLHPLVFSYVISGIVVVALPLARWWTSRGLGGLTAMATSSIAVHPITSASR
jgi:hypothetical protein